MLLDFGCAVMRGDGQADMNAQFEVHAAEGTNFSLGNPSHQAPEVVAALALTGKLRRGSNERVVVPLAGQDAFAAGVTLCVHVSVCVSHSPSLRPSLSVSPSLALALQVYLPCPPLLLFSSLVNNKMWARLHLLPLAGLACKWRCGCVACVCWHLRAACEVACPALTTRVFGKEQRLVLRTVCDALLLSVCGFVLSFVLSFFLSSCLARRWAWKVRACHGPRAPGP